MTQVGLMLEGQHGLNWQRWQNILRVAEESGYQCVFRSDHFTDAAGEDLDSLELWLSLAYAASHTKRIEFGSCVAPVTFRHPSFTARMAAQVDDLSGGRLVLGLGAGWQEREHKKFGIPFYDFTTRFAMLTDALEMTRLLFTSDTHVSYTGKHFSLDDALLLPRPSRAGGPPIMIGGKGPNKTLPLAAKYAQEWNAVFISLKELKEKSALMDELLQKEGRSPSSMKRSLMTRVIYARDEAKLAERLANSKSTPEEMWEANGVIAGTGSYVVDKLSQFVEAGIERFMLQWIELDDIDGMEAMAADVLPHFHK